MYKVESDLTLVPFSPFTLTHERLNARRARADRLCRYKPVSEETRTARCHCGAVELACQGDPHPIVMCHCRLCQRRTGSPFHIAAWFREQDVVFKGQTRPFTRTSGDSGRPFTFNLCPECGTSVWWRSSSALLAGRIGVAGGCFADAGFPAPTVSIFEQHKQRWVVVPPGTASFAAVPTAEAARDLYEAP